MSEDLPREKLFNPEGARNAKVIDCFVNAVNTIKTTFLTEVLDSRSLDKVRNMSLDHIKIMAFFSGALGSLATALASKGALEGWIYPIPGNGIGDKLVSVLTNSAFDQGLPLEIDLPEGSLLKDRKITQTVLGSFIGIFDDGEKKNLVYTGRRLENK